MRSPLSESATVSSSSSKPKETLFSSDSHENLPRLSLSSQEKTNYREKTSVALRELHFTRSSLPPS